jgi:hypothetical protein
MNNDCRKTMYAGTVGRVFTVLYNREFLFTDFQERYVGVAKSEVCCLGIGLPSSFTWLVLSTSDLSLHRSSVLLKLQQIVICNKIFQKYTWSSHLPTSLWYTSVSKEACRCCTVWRSMRTLLRHSLPLKCHMVSGTDINVISLMPIRKVWPALHHLLQNSQVLNSSMCRSNYWLSYIWQ